MPGDLSDSREPQAGRQGGGGEAAGDEVTNDLRDLSAAAARPPCGFQGAGKPVGGFKRELFDPLLADQTRVDTESR